MARRPLAAFFVVVFGASAAASIVLGLPRLTPGGSPNPTSLAVFPALVVTVGLAGVTLTRFFDGPGATRELWSRMRRWRVPARYYAALLIPPTGILLTLSVLRLEVSPAFTPAFFALGIAFGVVAGCLEEIGWTGFAYPRLSARLGATRGALLLGLLWGLWHMPVVDSLGVATPHGPSWPWFFAAFVLLVMAVRLLICWLYSRTGSILIAQLMHASSTGFLVVLSAPHVSSRQEATWYAAYGAVLWMTIITAWLLQRAWPNRSAVAAIS